LCLKKMGINTRENGLVIILMEKASKFGLKEEK
jgi:hypothetical protein